jgi:hypothetical protein
LLLTTHTVVKEPRHHLTDPNTDSAEDHEEVAVWFVRGCWASACTVILMLQLSCACLSGDSWWAAPRTGDAGHGGRGVGDFLHGQHTSSSRATRPWGHGH